MPKVEMSSAEFVRYLVDKYENKNKRHKELSLVDRLVKKYKKTK